MFVIMLDNKTVFRNYKSLKHRLDTIELKIDLNKKNATDICWRIQGWNVQIIWSYLWSTYWQTCKAHYISLFVVDFSQIQAPVQSVPAFEILAAVESIAERKAISNTLSEIYRMENGIHICIDFRDLFTSLSTEQNSIDRSIRSDIAYIRYNFQVGNVDNITWIPGNINLADVLTKRERRLTDALQLTL